MTDWTFIKSLLENGINIVPVKDKRPITKWHKYQTERITEQELFYLNADNYAFVLGPISGNLFVIDIDCKYQSGIDAIYFKDIKDIFPELWEKLRIHKTPSGGYHIIYRLSAAAPKSAKLASRYATELELAENPKNKTKCFIETKGEGGLAALPTNDGYGIFKDCEIPTLSESEHETLINLAKSYNQVVKVEKPFAPSARKNDYYDENPFEHFNQSDEGEQVLETHGWQIVRRNSNLIWYTRPDGQKGDVHASFNLQKRIFYIFTTSTQFEPETGYNPSTALSILKFNGDKKATYKWLVDSGFGKVKPKFEQGAIKKLVRNGTEIPKNFSENAQIEYVAFSKKLAEIYPYGTFWEIDEEGAARISRIDFYRVAHLLGYCIYKDELYLLQNNILYEKTERDLQDAMAEYIREPEEDERLKILNANEAFMQKNGKFSISRLPIIDHNKILRDSKDCAYKYFKNGIIKVTADEFKSLSYSDLTDFYILGKSISNRDFTPSTERGIFEDFLSKATRLSEQTDHIHRVIGYLTHDFKDETTGYIVVLTEVCENPKDGGGSGKNLFCNLLANSISYHSKNGSQVNFDEKFFQSWTGQRIMGISDVPKNFKFEFLKEPATGTFILKKLYKNEVEIPISEGPKFVVQTNFSYEISDGGLKRRIIPLEFTNFFTIAGGIDAYYGYHFPSGWSENDWNTYDSFILLCLQKFLKNKCKLEPVGLSHSGRVKQFEFIYGKNILEFFTENISKIIERRQISSENLREMLTSYYNENQIAINFRISKNRFAESLKDYCRLSDIQFKSNILIYDGLTQKKGWEFNSPML